MDAPQTTESKFGILSTPSLFPAEEIASLLNSSEPITEISVQGWDDLEVVMDELASFFPFARNFNRTWESVKTCLADVCTKGRLILVTGIADESLENLGLFVDAAASSSGDAEKNVGKITLVLEGYTSATIKGKEGVHDVTPLQTPAAPSGDVAMYRMQVSGKRNHTFYVNLALKVLQRRPWYDKLELSGLGNAIPSIVSIAEILKRYQVARVRHIETSLVDLSDGEGKRTLQKAKMVVVLDKTASTPIVTDEDELGEQVV